MVFKIFHSHRFDKELEKFDNDFKGWLDKMESQLVENPHAGDPINYKWFREKKYKKYRIYFLVYEDLQSVFMVAISEKKDQQKVINSIKLFLGLFNDEIKSLLKGAII